MKRLVLAVVVCLIAICSVPTRSWADGTTYQVNQIVGAGSVTGFIKTDGTIGTLSAANIKDWNLVLTDSASTFDLLGPTSGLNSQLDLSGNSLTGSATNLLFDFGQAGFLSFHTSLFGGWGINFYALNTVGSQLTAGGSLESTPGSGVLGLGAVPEPSSLLLLGAGLLALTLASKRVLVS
jgi:hypothetical protein